MPPLSEPLSPQGIIAIAIGVPSFFVCLLSLWVAYLTLRVANSTRHQRLDAQVVVPPLVIHCCHDRVPLPHGDQPDPDIPLAI